MYSYSNGINSEDYECYYENYRLEEARRWLDLCVDMDAADDLKLSPNLRERWAWYLSSLEFLYDIKSWGAGHTFVNVMYEEEDKQFVEDVRKHRRKVIAETFERARVEASDKMVELLEMSCVMREYDARGKFSVEMFSERRGYTN